MNGKELYLHCVINAAIMRQNVPAWESLDEKSRSEWETAAAGIWQGTVTVHDDRGEVIASAPCRFFCRPDTGATVNLDQVGPFEMKPPDA